MRMQHLSDEAVAAYADGVLRGHPHERARRHTAECPECAHAVAVQREAVLALRAAGAPSLPSGLADRLRAVPVTTPIRTVPTAVDSDGSPMFATFGAAALVPQSRPAQRNWHLRPLAITAVALAAAGGVAAASAQAAHPSGSPGQVPAPLIRQVTVQQPLHAAPGEHHAR